MGYGPISFKQVFCHERGCIMKQEIDRTITSLFLQAGNGFDRNVDWDWEVRYVHETLGLGDGPLSWLTLSDIWDSFWVQ